jgi:hypothetical protein
LKSVPACHCDGRVMLTSLNDLPLSVARAALGLVALALGLV